ncbi:MAG: hypothetical protein V8Q76_05565 [Bacteroides intestinalis]
MDKSIASVISGRQQKPLLIAMRVYTAYIQYINMGNLINLSGYSGTDNRTYR